MMIDCHAHFVPTTFPEFKASAGDRWPSAEIDGDLLRVTVQGKPFRTLERHAWDLEARRAALGDRDVAGEVISPMPELLSYWAAPEDGREFARHVNAAMLDFAEPSEGVVKPLAMVPLQDVDLACAELARLREDGFVGVEIGTVVERRRVSEPEFEPFFSEAASQDLVVFVHAYRPLAVADLNVPSGWKATLGFPLELGSVATSMIVNGIHARIPGLKLLFSHCGGVTGALLGRVSQAWNTRTRLHEELPEPPQGHAKRFYYDTLTFDPASLELMLGWVGPERLVIGTDFPFELQEDPPGRALAEVADLDDQERELIYRANASALFGFSG